MCKPSSSLLSVASADAAKLRVSTCSSRKAAVLHFLASAVVLMTKGPRSRASVMISLNVLMTLDKGGLHGRWHDFRFRHDHAGNTVDFQLGRVEHADLSADSRFSLFYIVSQGIDETESLEETTLTALQRVGGFSPDKERVSETYLNLNLIGTTFVNGGRLLLFCSFLGAEGRELLFGPLSKIFAGISRKLARETYSTQSVAYAPSPLDAASSENASGLSELPDSLSAQWPVVPFAGIWRSATIAVKSERQRRY